MPKRRARTLTKLAPIFAIGIILGACSAARDNKADCKTKAPAEYDAVIGEIARHILYLYEIYPGGDIAAHDMTALKESAYNLIVDETENPAGLLKEFTRRHRCLVDIDTALIDFKKALGN